VNWGQLEDERKMQIPQPKIFISYSWTTQQHQEYVKHIADRLISDGVNVVLDIYDLKEGHDKYAFMESMITDASVTHVLVISDKEYARKADARKSGVGTESQIISNEVYTKVDQTKFIPLVFEFDSNEEPYLPTFMKSRIWINFSTPEKENDSWEQLLRLLYGKPQHVKPALGKTPSFIIDDTPSPTDSIYAKFQTLKNGILQEKKSVNLHRGDFIEACIDFADALRIRQQPTGDETQKVLDDYESLAIVRNYLCDWLAIECQIVDENKISPIITDVLDKIIELKSRPEQLTSWQPWWFEAHSIFVYDVFLYIVALMIKLEKFNILHEIFSSFYVIPVADANRVGEFSKFDRFFYNSEFLQERLSIQNRHPLFPVAEAIKNQAKRTDLTFEKLIQADALATLMSTIYNDTFWHPQLSYYMSYSTTLAFFIKLAQKRYFENLKVITGIDDADQLKVSITSGIERLRIDRVHPFSSRRSFSDTIRMNSWSTL